MAIIITTAVYSFGRMLVLDTIDILCFNPGKLTFKDNKGIWKFTECERQRALPSECHHKSTHHLTLKYELGIAEATTNALKLGALAPEYSWQGQSKEYKTMKNKLYNREIEV